MNKLNFFYASIFRNLSSNKTYLTQFIRNKTGSNIPKSKNLTESSKLKVLLTDVRPKNISEENFICHQEIEIMENLKKNEPQHPERMEKCLSNKAYRGHYGRLNKDARQEAYFYNDILECLTVLKTKHDTKPDIEKK